MSIRTMTVVDSIKSIMQTAIAIALVSMSGYGFLNDALDDKIRNIGVEIAMETLEHVRVDDSAFVLSKAVEKFKAGDARDIKRVNLELVLKYQDQIIKKYPEKRLEVKWCASFYDEHFVSVPTVYDESPT